MAESSERTGRPPKILVFSTNTISDPGIDSAGGSHISYPAGVEVIPVPCSSGVNPRWMVHALGAGFDGVFLAADGGDCAYLTDCTERTSKVMEKALALAEEAGHDPRRLRMAAICSVCGDSFASHMKKFEKTLMEMEEETSSE